MSRNVLNQLQGMQRRTDELSPSDFETRAGQQGKETVVAEIQADAVLKVRDGRTNPLRLAIPAYESDTLAGDGSEQTFSVNNSIAQTPVTQDVVVWFGGSYYGTPDSVDHANDSITVTGDGSGNTVHIFYISDDAATVTFEKANTGGDTSDDLKTLQAGLVAQTDQSEQPEYFDFSGDHPLKGFIATDQKLKIKVEAPYVTRFEDPDGDGATATNALLATPVQKGSGSIDGLAGEIRDQMA
jgi:hypothetical protein